MTICSSDLHVHRQHERVQYVAVPKTNTGEERGSVITPPVGKTRFVSRHRAGLRSRCSLPVKTWNRRETIDGATVWYYALPARELREP